MNQNDDKTLSDMDDPTFDQALQGLFRQALRDETFQRQVAQDLRTLPPDAQANLTAQHQAFVQDESLSTATRERMLAQLPPCDCPHAAQPSASPTPKVRTTWAERLTAWLNNSSFNAGFLPFVMIAGIVGIVCIPLILLEPETPTDVVRGGGNTASTTALTPSNTLDANGLNDAIRAQQPQQWLQVIAQLVERGNITSALSEWREFNFRHGELVTATQQGGNAVPPLRSTPAMRQQPQQWLAAMAQWIRAGDLATFNAEFEQFRLQYPNYRPR